MHPLRPVSLLQYSIAAVLGVRALELLLHHRPAHLGVSPWIVVILAAIELVAAVLFLVPRTRDGGGYVLLAVLLAATSIHLFLREAPSLDFLVYATAIWVVLSDSRPAASRSA